MLPSALFSPSLSFFSRAFQSLFLLQCCFLLLFSCHLTPFLGSRGTSCLVVSMSFFQLSPILLLLFVCHNWHWLYFRWLFSCTLSCWSTLCDSCSYLRWRSCNSLQCWAWRCTPRTRSFLHWWSCNSHQWRTRRCYPGTRVRWWTDELLEPATETSLTCTIYRYFKNNDRHWESSTSADKDFAL